MKTKTALISLYCFPGFRARSRFKGVFGDPNARIIIQERRQKKRLVPVVALAGASMTTLSIGSETWTPVACASTSSLSIAAYSVGAAKL
jgi:hypothetical protein